METRGVPSIAVCIPAPARVRRARRWWLALVLVLVGSPLVLGDVAVTREDELKSAIVLSFLRYAEWPGRTAPEARLMVGVIGRSSMVSALRRTLEDKPINNRTIRVMEMKAFSDPLCCQVVYVATGKAAEIRLALAGTRSSRILTIGEADRFLEFGGAVNLVMVDGHMAFEANLSALEQSGISVSSKLLRYGQVHRRPPA